MMRRFLAVGLIAAVVVIAAVIAGRTLLLDTDEAGVVTVDHPELDAERLSTVLAGALRFPTLSYYDRTLMDRAAFAEKGYLTLRLTTTDQGGHSSMPPSNTAAGRLARALARLEDNPLPASLDGVPGKLLSALAPHFSLGQRVAMANLWLSGPMVVGQLAQGRATNALIRTTTAITVMRSGDKDNVLPQAAEAFVNFRLRPGDSVDDVIAHVKDTVDDPAVTATVAGNATNASRISSLDSLGYRVIATAVGQVMPDAVVAPGMTLAGTDSTHYAALPRCGLGAGDARRIHGTDADERIGVANYVEMVRFYIQLMRNVDALTPAVD